MTIKKFDEIGSWPARALQAYQILIGAASNRQILTYALLAEKIDRKKGQHTLSQTLGHLMYWRQFNDLPSLTSLVVKKDGGLPREGLSAPEDVNRERERAYAHRWYLIVPPTMDELAAAYAEGHAGLED